MAEDNKNPQYYAQITDIQRFSVHDGPGIRTVIFFKGCPLYCIWCQNPETQSMCPEHMYFETLCINCLACLSACPVGAISQIDGEFVVDRHRCNLCGNCEKVCYSGARKLIGKKRIYIEDVMKTVLSDRVFYKNTKGGVTFSGGEVTLQLPFAIELAKRLKEQDIHVAIETCGYCNWNEFKKLLKYTDLILFDIKHTDSKIHQSLTGVGNEMILNNLKKAAEMHKQIIIRYPLIPGVNDDDSTIIEVAKIAKNCHVQEVHILGFHQLGENKWHALDYPYLCSEYRSPTPAEMEAAKTILTDYGLKVNLGGSGN